MATEWLISFGLTQACSTMLPFSSLRYITNIRFSSPIWFADNPTPDRSLYLAETSGSWLFFKNCIMHCSAS
ncbi:hypothetical protein D3C85_1382760 [compost metagenome]